MILFQSKTNPLLIVDELGNPMFAYIGSHPGDVEELLKEHCNSAAKETALERMAHIRDKVEEIQKVLRSIEDEYPDMEGYVRDIESAVESIEYYTDCVDEAF